MASGHNKLIAKNVLMLYIRMFLSMAITFYTSRVVLNILGVEDFGIYNVVAGVVVMFTFIKSAMETTTLRFLSASIGIGDESEVKKVFSMSVISHISIAVIVFVLAETIGLFFLNRYMNIPDGRLVAANWIYQSSIFITCISIIQVPYMTAFLSYEKMSFYAYISIVETFLKLAVALLLIWIEYDKLKLYGLLLCAVSVIIFLLYRVFCGRKFTACRFSFYKDTKLYKEMMSFSGWSLLGSGAVIGADQGGNILLNYFYGVVANASMGIAGQVNIAVYGFVSNLQIAFRPQIVKLYTQGDKEQLEILVCRSSRISFLLLYALAIPLILNMGFVLELWLKIVPEYTVTFCRLILSISLIVCVAIPLVMTKQAVGNIRNYQLLIGFIIISNIAFSYLFLSAGYYIQIVLVVKMIIEIICLFVRLYFVRNVIRPLFFLKDVLYRSLKIVLLTLPLPLYLSWQYNKWEGLFFSLSTFAILLLISTYFIGFSKEEIATLKKLLKDKFKK